MPTVRRSCALAFIVGISCWLASTVTDDHANVRTLVELGPGRGVVVSDIPRLLTWAVLVGLGVRALR